MDDTLYDVAVVGAGAAGLMASIMARRLSLHTLLLDGKEKIGAKILMSGGTRCNVTNLEIREQDYHSEKIHPVRNVLRAFSSGETVHFFKELKVDLILEEDGKFFPSTHSARTILEALVKEVERLGVVLETSRKVTRAVFETDHFRVSGENFSFKSKTLVLCTGGLSYPGTGSDGSGYGIAKSFGHSLVQTIPALTPFESGDPDWKSLSGVALPCRLTIKANGEKEAVYQDDFLFTHFGFSGPAALNMSRHWLRAKDAGQAELIACFLPQESEEAFRTNVVRVVQQNPRWTLKRFLSQKLPERFIEVLLRKIDVAGTTILNQFSQKDRERLVAGLFRLPLPVSGVVGYRKSEVTAGGVDFAGVEPSTLESRIQPGLFFAGEILDVDGRIGGFNFQWAWSSGVIAARGVAKQLRGG